MLMVRPGQQGARKAPGDTSRTLATPCAGGSHATRGAGGLVAAVPARFCGNPTADARRHAIILGTQAGGVVLRGACRGSIQLLQRCTSPSQLRSASARDDMMRPQKLRVCVQARLVFEGLQLKAFVLASRQERMAALQADAKHAVELTPDAWLQVRGSCVSGCALAGKCRHLRQPFTCRRHACHRVPT